MMPYRWGHSLCFGIALVAVYCLRGPLGDFAAGMFAYWGLGHANEAFEGWSAHWRRRRYP